MDSTCFENVYDGIMMGFTVGVHSERRRDWVHDFVFHARTLSICKEGTEDEEIREGGLYTRRE